MITCRASKRASALTWRQSSIPSRAGSPRSSRQISHFCRSRTSSPSPPVGQAVAFVAVALMTFEAGGDGDGLRAGRAEDLRQQTDDRRIVVDEHDAKRRARPMAVGVATASRQGVFAAV